MYNNERQSLNDQIKQCVNMKSITDYVGITKYQMFKNSNCGTTSYDLISDVPENATNLHVNAQNQNELSAKSHCWRWYGFLTGRNESACLTFRTRRINSESLAINGNKAQRYSANTDLSTAVYILAFADRIFLWNAS